MIHAEVKNVSFEALQAALPGETLPKWSIYDVVFNMGKDDTEVNIGGLYKFNLNRSEGMRILKLLWDSQKK